MHEDGHLGQVWLRAQTATQFGATHHGHHPVRDNQVRQAFPYRFQRLRTICGAAHFIPLCAQYQMPCREQVGFVVDKQNRFHETLARRYAFSLLSDACTCQQGMFQQLD